MQIKLPIKLPKIPKQNIKKKIAIPFENKIVRQAMLTVIAVVLTVVLVFAITAAWYNNVLKTDVMNFKASPWGFDGEVTIDNSLIDAAPGSNGSIPLTVTNPTDKIISVIINVDKSGMSEDLKKRIFFYCDDQLTANGEMVDKVYLNSLNTYSYRLLSNQSLVLSEARSSDARIYWEWTYDMLGYYFIGRVDAAAIYEEEYISPIVYDYDLATFTADGKLKTVDGTTSVKEFIAEISAKDGFEGTVDTDTAVNGCYPVSVSEGGYGVWIRLCNKDEITSANISDTLLGNESADTPQFSATMSVLGQVLEYNTVEVSTESELKEAISGGKQEIIKLLSDINISSAINIESSTVIIDLGGKTLSTDIISDCFNVSDNSELIVINGSIASTGNGELFHIKGSNLSIGKVSVEAIGKIIYIDDKNLIDDSRVSIFSSTLTTPDSSVYIAGNGIKSARCTNLTIDASTITSTSGIAIDQYNNEAYFGTRIEISNSVVRGRNAAVNHIYRNSELLISGNNEIIGTNAILLSSGSLKICDSVLTADSEVIKINNSGDYSVKVNITGEKTKFNGTKSIIISNANKENVILNIRAGEYPDDISAYLTSGYHLTENNGRYTVTLF